MSVKIEAITKPLLLGEGPHWDARQRALFFIDIVGTSLHKYVLATGEHTQTKFSDSVSFIIPIEGTTDQFVIGSKRRFLVIRWDGKDGGQVEELKELFEVDQDKPENSLNDGKVDSRGRLYCGSIASFTKAERPEDDHLEVGLKFDIGKGSLFRLDGDVKFTKVDTGVTVANGLAWDDKEAAMYYVDSYERNVRRYDYNVETGDISNKKYIFDLEKNAIRGYPDGMTIDTDGNLWVALYKGSCVIKIDPRTGNLLYKLDLTESEVTSVTFGGPNLDILFVTTGHGPLYKVTGLGVNGHPNLNFKM